MQEGDPCTGPRGAAERAGDMVRHALLVAADPVTLRLCREVLVLSGVTVDVVDSGVAAVVAARENRPDLIVVDDQLRDVVGREAVGWLRSNPALAATPIVVLAAKAENDAERAAVAPGAWLRKPLSPDLVRRTIQDALS